MNARDVDLIRKSATENTSQYRSTAGSLERMTSLQPARRRVIFTVDVAGIASLMDRHPVFHLRSFVDGDAGIAVGRADRGRRIARRDPALVVVCIRGLVEPANASPNGGLRRPGAAPGRHGNRWRPHSTFALASVLGRTRIFRGYQWVEPVLEPS